MNFWKPIALCSIAALGMTIAPQLASAAAASGNVKGEATLQGGPCHDQPHMAEAVQRVKEARSSLDRAEHNKGGWRDRAIQHLDIAIKETDNGCNYADTH